jgi:hypothetical protein
VKSAHPDEEYLTWLYGKVASVHLRSRQRSYWTLFRQLYKKEFVWNHPRDENRAHDAVALRGDFMDEEDWGYMDREWFDAPPSVLEVLVAIARRLSVEVDGEPRQWFWEMMHNLGLESFNDASQYPPKEVEVILDTLVRRKYTRDGRGGLFPLRHADRDQRQVELWYQLQSYLIEND